MPDLLGTLAACGLPGTLHELRLPDPGTAAWANLLGHIESHDLTGLMTAAVERGAVVLHEEQRQELSVTHTRAMVKVLMLERALVEVVHTLRSEGLDSRVLKGSALAHLDYANPSQRSYNDIDLLVRSDQLVDAVDTLGRLGFRRRSIAPSPAFELRYGKGVTLLGGDGLEVDLHRTLVSGRFGVTIDQSDLWRDAELFTVGGCTLEALPVEMRLLHASYHATIGNPHGRILPLRDLAELSLYGEWDAHRLRQLSRRWCADAVLATALQESWERLALQDETALSAWARRFEVSSVERRHLTLMRDGRSSYTLQQLAAMTALPWSERARFLFSLAVPSRQFLASRGNSLPQHLSRAAGRVVHR